MYGIFTYIYHKNQPNVGKYTIHGSCGFGAQGSPCTNPIFPYLAAKGLSCIIEALAKKMEGTNSLSSMFFYSLTKLNFIFNYIFLKSKPSIDKQYMYR